MFFGSVSGLAEIVSGRVGVEVGGGVTLATGGGLVPERSVTGASGVVSFEAHAAASRAATMQRAAFFMVFLLLCGSNMGGGAGAQLVGSGPHAGSCTSPAAEVSLWRTRP